MKLIAYGKTNWGKDFPSALEDQAEAKKICLCLSLCIEPLAKGACKWRQAHYEIVLSPGNPTTPAWNSIEASGDPNGSLNHEANRLG